ncbi:MAG: hypothetical protein RBR23_08920 [Arcobacteraceae bacterium]|jgi:nanoRNase/pAp phosphatase (c-di-AMP/oligoRNAs hydrolase)|nr:hypothetical protein [Arcobacteraceae bacterium]
MNTNKLKTLSFLKTLFFPLSKRVYIVGGYVRDNILGIDSDDIDIEVYDINIEKFTEIMNQIGAIGVGKSFFVYKYEGIDISLPRTETKVGQGHQGFDVSYINDEKIASRRRDFTINALMQNLYTDEILDFYGGIEDLKSRIIKIVDEKTFSEDSLRVLRGIRFAAKFGFKIDKKSFSIIQKISLDDLSTERISKELELIFQTKYLEYGFFYLYKIGFLKKYFHVDIEIKTFFTIYRLLKTKKRFFKSELYEYYLVYIINCFHKVDFSVLKSNKYEKIIHRQPLLNFSISDRDLCIIALDMPISRWFGALSVSIIQRAKILGIYENKLKTDVNPQEIIEAGFTGTSIKSEYLMRNLKYIDDKITKRQQRRDNMDKKYRLVTRSDMDGLVCATLLKYVDIIDDILFVHPKDMQDGKIAITENDITTNLPYVEGVHLAFDHHLSETIRNGKKDNHIIIPDAPSAAEVVYEYYGAEMSFPPSFKPMMDAANKADAAQFSKEDILDPQGWDLLSFLMDSRTGLGRFREFRISNYQLMMDLIDYCKDHTIEEIMKLPDVKERVELYNKYRDDFVEQLHNVSTIKDNLIIVDYRDEEIIYPGNRFMIYALYPECNISMHIIWGREKQNTVLAVGHSIINKTCKTVVGELMLQYGGGGHEKAGTCQLDNDKVESQMLEIIDVIVKNG